MIQIIIEQSRDWGCDYTADDRDNYYQLCKGAISAIYPYAKVTVVSSYMSKATVIGDSNEESAVAEIDETEINQICQEIWAAGNFW
jgi:hypothetical protein